MSNLASPAVFLWVRFIAVAPSRLLGPLLSFAVPVYSFRFHSVPSICIAEPCPPVPGGGGTLRLAVLGVSCDGKLLCGREAQSRSQCREVPCCLFLHMGKPFSSVSCFLCAYPALSSGRSPACLPDSCSRHPGDSHLHPTLGVGLLLRVN